MERVGYVGRLPRPSDRRGSAVRTPPPGPTAAGEHLAPLAEDLPEAGKHLTEGGRATAGAYLAAVTDVFVRHVWGGEAP